MGRISRPESLSESRAGRRSLAGLAGWSGLLRVELGGNAAVFSRGIVPSSNVQKANWKKRSDWDRLGHRAPGSCVQRNGDKCGCRAGEWARRKKAGSSESGTSR